MSRVDTYDKPQGRKLSCGLHHLVKVDGLMLLVMGLRETKWRDERRELWLFRIVEKKTSHRTNSLATTEEMPGRGYIYLTQAAVLLLVARRGGIRSRRIPSRFVGVVVFTRRS